MVLRYITTSVVMAIAWCLCGTSICIAQIAEYPLNENEGDVAYDISENANNGQILGPVWTTGKYEAALLFDGQNDRIDIQNLDIPTDQMTISVWINAQSFPGDFEDPRIIAKTSGTGEQDHYWMLSAIKSDGCRLRFRLKTDGQTSTLIGPELTTDQWIHVAATYDGQYMRLYKDGIETHKLAKQGSINRNASIPTWIGDSPPTAGTRPWHGVIDDVYIYDRALTDNEIQYVMANGSTNQPPIVSITQPADNTTVSAGSSVTVQVDAQDNDDYVGTVELFINDTFHAHDNSEPFSFTIPDVQPGTYTFTATAEDPDGAVVTSNPVTLIVTEEPGDDPRDIDWVHRSTTQGELENPTASGDEQTASLVLDINNDNITDFVITDRSQSPSVVWYESSGQGTWTRRVIDNDVLPIEAGGAYYDIDGDGDRDIVMGGDYQSNHIWWWENPAPDFDNPWTRRTIKTSGSKKHHDQMFGDFDGDQQTELVFWNQDARKLYIAEIPADPHAATVWSYTAIYEWSSGPEHEGFAAADIDNDGQMDIIGGGRWFKHNGDTNYTASIIDASQTFGRTAAGQLIPGGYAEVVMGPGDGIGNLVFYRYDGSNWSQTTLKTDVDHGHSLFLADFDGDGLPDIFCAEMRLNSGNPDAKMWIFFNDGDGQFTETLVAEGLGNHESRPADLDGDGDVDILTKPYNFDAPRLDIFLNNGTGEPAMPIDQWERHLVDANMPDNAVFVEAGDLNNDGLTDLAAGGWWYLNNGSLATPWTRNTIGQPLNNALVLHDFDNDGDLDIFGSQGVGAEADNRLAWAENDGTGSFVVRTNISTGGTGDFIQGRVLADFGYGKQIALSWHNGGGGVHAIIIPSQPATFNWPFGMFSDTTQQEDLSAGDIDNDGDMDLLLGTKWLRNSPTPPNVFTLGQIDDLDADAEPDRNDLADINGDGRLDAVVALENGTHVLWFEAPADPTQPWTRHIVGTVAGQGFSMDVADFDQDGQPDIVIGEHRGATDNRVIIFRNNNHGLSFTPVVIDSDSKDVIDHHDGTQAVDLDGDGDLDIISVGWYNKKIWIYENKAINGKPAASVIDKHIFYNDSAWDDNNPAVDMNDDNAIAPDKKTLAPGEQPGHEHYSSYNKGINGLMIDMKNLPVLPTSDDFDFHTGNSLTPETWQRAPLPQSIILRPGAGTQQSDRITLTWADDAVKKKWLRVKIKSTVNTGLPEPEVFYFGNAVGDTCDQPDNAIVDASDLINCRNNPHHFMNPADLDNVFDFNRDKKVDATDQVIAKNNITTFINALKLQSFAE